MDELSPEKLKSQIALLEELLREKREALKVAEAIEKQQDDLWRRHIVNLPSEENKTKQYDVRK